MGSVSPTSGMRAVVPASVLNAMKAAAAAIEQPRLALAHLLLERMPVRGAEQAIGHQGRGQDGDDQAVGNLHDDAPFTPKLIRSGARPPSDSLIGFNPPLLPSPLAGEGGGRMPVG